MLNNISGMLYLKKIKSLLTKMYNISKNHHLLSLKASK